MKPKIKNLKLKKGQSLVEILVAIALGVVLIGGSVTLMGVSLRGYRSFKNHLEAIISTRQAMEITQAIIRANWHSIADLTPGIHYKIAKRGNAFTFQKGEEKVFDDTNLVAYWNMDEGTGQTSYDNRNTNNGTLINSPTWKSGSDCVSSSCLEFNGSNEYVNYGNKSDFNITDTITISTWIYQKEQSTSWNGIVSKTDGNTNGWEIRTTTAGSNSIQCRILNGSDISASTTITNESWNHVVCTYDGSVIRIYVNGVQKNTALQPNGIATNSRSLSIGKLAYSGLYFNGSIDEVRIYDTALSVEEIREHYKSGLDKLGLVGYWGMDENGGTTIYNNANSNNGTLYNNPTWKSGSDCASGSCLGFDGVNDWALLGDAEINGAMTLGFWFYTPNKNQQYFFDNRDPGSWWFIKNYAGGTCGEIPGNICFEGRVMAKDSDWNINEWTHLVVTDDTFTAKMYINGKLIDTGLGEVSIISTNLHIGTRYTNSSYFNGLIDEVRVYNRALSLEEINNRYQAGYTRYIVFNKTSRTSGNIDTTYNSDNYDSSTLKTLSVVKYGEGLVSQQSGGILSTANYFTRSNNSKVFHQTDWSGGSGVTGPVSNPSNKYDTSTNIKISTIGQITMATTTPDGTLTSSIFDTGVSGGAGFNSLLWQGSLGSQGTVKFQVAFSDDEDGPWIYYGLTSTSDWYQPNPDVSVSFPTAGLASPQNKRYIRCKINLSTVSTTPQIDDIIINWTP